MMTRASNAPSFDPEEHKSRSKGREVDDDLDELREPPQRDLFDSPSDSWRDLELLELLDDLDPEPVERADA